MKRFKNQIIGILAFFFVLIGLANAAEQISFKGDIISKQEIKTFASLCSGGIDPR